MKNENSYNPVAFDMLETIVLRGLCFLPCTRVTFEIGRPRSIKALMLSLATERTIFLVSQKDINVQEPKKDDICKTGVVGYIEKCKKLENGNFQLVVYCKYRSKVYDYEVKNEVTFCRVTRCKTDNDNLSHSEKLFQIQKLWSFLDEFTSITSIKNAEGIDEARKMSDLGDMVDYLSSLLFTNIEGRQTILDEFDSSVRAENFCALIVKEAVEAELENELASKTMASIKEAEKNHFLREQLRIIQNELNEGFAEEDELQEDDGDYYTRVKNADIPSEVKSKLLKDVVKLKKMPFGSMENSLLSSYLDVCLEMPWNVASDDTIDIEKAKKTLDEQHTGMEKVKERILEYLSVKLLNKDPASQIICLVGAPGVGKTSIVSSIAEAMNRKYVRVSLGGIRDEAEIRGHRKTYVGSMPGRIINAIKSAGVNNPLILLDEIDKLTADAHGDPTSALLEVLDSEQNHSFRDHFIEVPFDLSKCFFIATANTLSTVPKPLLDRMEVIELESYTEVEKLAIAKNHLVPKQLKRHGLKKSQVKFSDTAIMKIIDCYTREAGVRNLEREIASICRKCAKIIVTGEKKSVTVNDKIVKELLGPETFERDTIYAEDNVGIVNGLAWTSVGGELLRIEAISMDGSGKVELTGSLGTVMKESAMAAISYIRKHSNEYGIDSSFGSKKDIHIHFPEGAVPKDGPSAGIAITSAILSELSGRKIKRDVAMTGEITLTGKVLPIGGLKEKTMAAYKAGVKTVILPKANEKDISKLGKFIKEKLEFRYVSTYDEVVSSAFVE